MWQKKHCRYWIYKNTLTATQFIKMLGCLSKSIMYNILKRKDSKKIIICCGLRPLTHFEVKIRQAIFNGRQLAEPCSILVYSLWFWWFHLNLASFSICSIKLDFSFNASAWSIYLFIFNMLHSITIKLTMHSFPQHSKPEPWLSWPRRTQTSLWLNAT